MLIDTLFIVYNLVLWNFVFDKLLYNLKDVNISRNIRSLLTMVIFICSYLIFGSEYYRELAIFTFSSYLYDTYLIFYHYRENLKPHLVYILHHYICLATSFYNYIGKDSMFILGGYLCLDLSNIFLYIAAISLKLYPKNNKLNNSLLILEYITYVYYRVFKLTLHYFNYIENIKNFNIHDKVILILLYSMGIIWSFKLSRIVYKKFIK